MTGTPGGPELHTYAVQRFRMEPGQPLTFPGGERIVTVLLSDVVLGRSYESRTIDVIALVELPADPASERLTP